MIEKLLTNENPQELAHHTYKTLHYNTRLLQYFLLEFIQQYAPIYNKKFIKKHLNDNDNPKKRLSPYSLNLLTIDAYQRFIIVQNNPHIPDNILNLITGKEFNPPPQTQNTTTLAQTIYQNNLPYGPILADAIQEEGCNNEIMLESLRNIPLFKGHFVLDSLLNKRSWNPKLTKTIPSD